MSPASGVTRRRAPTAGFPYTSLITVGPPRTSSLPKSPEKPKPTRKGSTSASEVQGADVMSSPMRAHRDPISKPTDTAGDAAFVSHATPRPSVVSRYTNADGSTSISSTVVRGGGRRRGGGGGRADARVESR